MPICGTPAVPVCRAVPIREHRACGYKRKSRAAMARDFSVGNSGLSLSGRTQDAFAFVHVELLQLVAGRAQVFAGVELNEKYNNCEIRYGDMKKQLAEDINKFCAPIRERILDMAANTEYLDKVARMGAEKARESASKTLNEVRQIIGFRPY